MKNFIFIINKNSGTKKNITKDRIQKYLPRNINPIIHFTNSKQEAENVLNKYDNEEYFVACGGDGTVNFIMSRIINTNKKLFIMPLGSGNSTARHLSIPMGIKSLKRLKKEFSIIKSDVISFNNKKGIAVSGIGLDGEIANKFENLKIRGIKSYIIISLKVIFNFKPFKTEIILNNGSIIKEENLLLVSLANTNQFGNNAFIAPKASISDRLIDICLLKKPPFFKVPIILYYLFNKKINKSKYYLNFKSKNAVIETNTALYYHTDGESFNTTSKKFKCSINDYINIIY